MKEFTTVGQTAAETVNVSKSQANVVRVATGGVLDGRVYERICFWSAGWRMVVARPVARFPK